MVDTDLKSVKPLHWNIYLDDKVTYTHIHFSVFANMAEYNYAE